MLTHRPARAQPLTALLVACSLAPLVIGATVAAGSPQPTATASRVTLRRAIAHRDAADRAVAWRVKMLRRCLRAHPHHCLSARRALKRARARRAGAERRLHSLARASRLSASKRAPTLRVSGETLSWNAIGGVSSYVLARKAPGRSTEYSTVESTSTTPPAVPGTTGSYGVRTNVRGSAWSAEVSIAYPPSEPAPAASSTGTTAGDFGQSFVKGVDTNLQGWGAEAVPQIASEMQTLGANWAREDLSWSSVESQKGVFDWSSFDQLVATARANGITILPIVGYAPSWTTPGDATDYAAFVKVAVERYGPGTPANLQWWELWNEPYYAYAWSGKTPEPGAYARDVLAAAEAARSVSSSVRLLVAADYQDAPQTGGSTSWVTGWIDDMFTAAPTLGKWIDGVSVHPYGDDPALPLAKAGGWKDVYGQWAFQRIDTIRSKFLAHAVNVPFWITEEGWSTAQVSEATQAQYYADLAPQIAARSWIRAAFPYCLREFSATASKESQFGLLKYGTWQPKNAFYKLQEGLKTLG